MGHGTTVPGHFDIDLVIYSRGKHTYLSSHLFSTIPPLLPTLSLSLSLSLSPPLSPSLPHPFSLPLSLSLYYFSNVVPKPFLYTQT